MAEGGELHSRLRTARECSGLTQAELAARAGFAVNTLKQYESGRIKPGAEALAGYARAGINVMYLLLGEGSPLNSAGTAYAIPPPEPGMLVAEHHGARWEVPLPHAAQIMRAVIIGIDNCLAELGQSLSDARKAELAGVLFEQFVDEGTMPRPATILRFVRAAIGA